MEKKYSKSLQKHIVQCPHCGGDVLDHMTECIHCKGKLTPRGYTPALDSTTEKRIKTILWIVLSIIAIALILWRLAK